MQEASVQTHQKDCFAVKPAGSISPFTKVRFIFSTTLINLSHKWFCEIRSHAIGIISVVIVGVAVRVDIAEIVAVVVISRPLPPIRTRPNKIYRNTPNFCYLLLSLFITLVMRLFSLSINSPRCCDICSNFFVAVPASTVLPLEVVKAPSGFFIIA